MLGRRTTRLKIMTAGRNDRVWGDVAASFMRWGAARVLAASDLAEAVSLLRHDPVEFLVVDWDLPPGGAVPLLRWVREDGASPNRQLPIIVTTADPDVAVVRRASSCGADSVMAAPVTPLALARRIETLLATPREARAASPFCAGVADQSPGLPGWVALASHDDERCRAMADLVGRLDAAIVASGPALPAALLEELYRAASDHPLVQELCALLGVCLGAVRVGAPGRADTIHAHLAGLRWAVSGDRRKEQAVHRLLGCLRTTVRDLLRRHPSPQAATARPPSGGQGRCGPEHSVRCDVPRVRTCRTVTATPRPVIATHTSRRTPSA